MAKRKTLPLKEAHIQSVIKETGICVQDCQWQHIPGKRKPDMPLYLATAQTNQNSFPQAENSDGEYNINHDTKKIKLILTNPVRNSILCTLREQSATADSFKRITSPERR